MNDLLCRFALGSCWENASNPKLWSRESKDAPSARFPSGFYVDFYCSYLRTVIFSRDALDARETDGFGSQQPAATS